MSDSECAEARADWARSVRGVFLWGLPVMALGASGALLPAHALVFVWPPAIALMGAACLLNARRCGRVHCYATGPFLLIVAALALLYGIGVLPLGPHGWSLLSEVLLVGALVLCCVPEWLFGRYRTTAVRHR